MPSELWAWIFFGLFVGFGYLMVSWLTEQSDADLEEVERTEAALEALRRLT